MTALVNTTVPLDIAVYDQMSTGLVDACKAARGFRSHAAYPVPGGFMVSEIWDSADDHRAFFDSALKPNMPEGVAVEVIELRNTFSV
jgi:heme-degrading monooxygenase HmoA